MMNHVSRGSWKTDNGGLSVENFADLQIYKNNQRPETEKFHKPKP